MSIVSGEFLTWDRRLIGRRFDDPTVKKDIESWPFKVVDQDGSPMVEVEYLGENKIFSPQEISSMVLTKVRKASQNHSDILLLTNSNR
jgi:heat shock protein 1/8